MPAEHDPTIAPSYSGPRFTVTPYQPEGGCPVVGTVALFATVIITGGIAGWLVNRLMEKINLCCCGGPVQLALLGYAIGAIGGAALTMGKVRSPSVAGFAGLLGMIASVFGQLFSEYQLDMQAQAAQAQGQARPQVNFANFLDYLSQLNIPELFPLGIGLVIGAGSCYAMMANLAARPFDPVAEQWKKRVELGRLRMPRGEAVRVIQSGELTRLATVELRDKGVGAMLIAYVSPLGAPQATIDLELEEVIRNDKKREQRTRLGMWTYPGEAWTVLDYIYPGAIPLQPRHPDDLQAEERYE